jgi:hypothetical protein
MYERLDVSLAGIPSHPPAISAAILCVMEVGQANTYGVAWRGPTCRPQHFKARIAARFGVDALVVDWEQRRACCAG